MRTDGRIQEGCIGAMGPEDESKMIMAIGHKDHGEAWDDVTGEKLEWGGVHKI